MAPRLRLNAEEILLFDCDVDFKTEFFETRSDAPGNATSPRDSSCPQLKKILVRYILLRLQPNGMALSRGAYDVTGRGCSAG